MPDYQKGKIYKLWSPQGTEDELYFGSTTDELYKRKNQHKSKRDCKSKILFEKYDDVRIELVEDYQCNNKEELLKKEGEYIRNNKCLNQVIPDRTKKEYNKQNKEQIAEQKKIYRENNIEQIKEKEKEYREQNKEKIAEYDKEYYQNNKEAIKEQTKEYREQNKEAIAEYNKEYYQNNKEAIKEKKKEKITCECGCIIGKRVLARHKKSNKHITLLENL